MIVSLPFLSPLPFQPFSLYPILPCPFLSSSFFRVTFSCNFSSTAHFNSTTSRFPIIPLLPISPLPLPLPILLFSQSPLSLFPFQSSLSVNLPLHITFIFPLILPHIQPTSIFHIMLPLFCPNSSPSNIHITLPFPFSPHRCPFTSPSLNFHTTPLLCPCPPLSLPPSSSPSSFHTMSHLPFLPSPLFYSPQAKCLPHATPSTPPIKYPPSSSLYLAPSTLLPVPPSSHLLQFITPSSLFPPHLPT